MAAMAADCTGNEALYSVRRTQTMPKHSLFGTALEITVRNSCDGEADIEEQASRRKNIPDHPLGRAVVRKREDVARQKEIVHQKQKELESAEKKALSFTPDPRTVILGSVAVGSESSHVDKSHQWFTKKDLEHSKELNTGGLPKSRNYNRDKYGRRPRLLTYSSIGNSLQADLNVTSYEDADGTSKYPSRKPHSRTTITNEGEVRRGSGEHAHAYQSVIDLPPNIRHRFGSKICDALLSDQDQVDDALARQRKAGRPRRRRQPVDVPDFHKGGSPVYDLLSNATRQNVFPGYSTCYKSGVTKSVYTGSVFAQRYPDPDKFRYHRDDFNVWSECQAMRTRLGKQWEEYLSHQPKISANWDRGAKRLPVKTTEPHPKIKRKERPKHADRKAKIEPAEETSTPFEPVEFNTPPITPPPPLPAPMVMPEKFEKDDAFWEFFDQEVAT